MPETNVVPIAEHMRERSAWLDPRFIVTLLALIFGNAGGLIGVYVLSETKSAKIEVVVSSIDSKLTRIEASVQQVTSTVASLQSEQAQNRREIDDLKRKQEAQDAWISVINKQLANVQARQDVLKGR